MARFTKFPGLEIETNVLDSVDLTIVRDVKPGGAYGHSVAIGRLEAMWPLPLKIRSALRDTRQLAFRSGAETLLDTTDWEWEVTVYPNRSPGDRSALLICVPAKIRKQDKITVKVSGRGIEEEVPIEVKVV